MVGVVPILLDQREQPCIGGKHILRRVERRGQTLRVIASKERCDCEERLSTNVLYAKDSRCLWGEKKQSGAEERDDGVDGRVGVFHEQRVTFVFDDFEFRALNFGGDTFAQVGRTGHIEGADTYEHGDAQRVDAVVTRWRDGCRFEFVGE